MTDDCLQLAASGAGGGALIGLLACAIVLIVAGVIAITVRRGRTRTTSVVVLALALAGGVSLLPATPAHASTTCTTPDSAPAAPAPTSAPSPTASPNVRGSVILVDAGGLIARTLDLIERFPSESVVSLPFVNADGDEQWVSASLADLVTACDATPFSAELFISVYDAQTRLVVSTGPWPAGTGDSTGSVTFGDLPLGSYGMLVSLLPLTVGELAPEHPAPLTVEYSSPISACTDLGPVGYRVAEGTLAEAYGNFGALSALPVDFQAFPGDTLTLTAEQPTGEFRVGGLGQ